MRRWVLLLTFVVPTVIGAQQQVPPPSRQLTESSTQRLNVPPFSAPGSPECDDNGDLFFHLSRPGTFGDSMVLKLSTDSSTPVLYHLDPSLADKTAFKAFAVTPSGEVEMLDRLLDGGGLEILTFDSDGTMSSQTKLAAPTDLDPIDFMTSQDGLAFLTGYFDDTSPKSQQGNLFEGIFDRSGSLREQIQPEDLKKVDLKNAPMLGNKTASWAVDGNFYVLRPDEVLVMSEGGAIVRRIPYERDKQSDPTSQPITISTAMGLVSIGFINLDEHKTARSEYLVLDGASGAIVGYYMPPEGTGSGFAECFSGTGYTFLARDKQGLKLITAGLN